MCCPASAQAESPAPTWWNAGTGWCWRTPRTLPESRPSGSWRSAPGGSSPSRWSCFRCSRPSDPASARGCLSSPGRRARTAWPAAAPSPEGLGPARSAGRSWPRVGAARLSLSRRAAPARPGARSSTRAGRMGPSRSMKVLPMESTCTTGFFPMTISSSREPGCLARVWRCAAYR